MDIIKHITEGLYSDQEVVIPGFGKFIGERKAAQIENGVIYPPTKTVSFVRDTNSFALDLAIQVASKERVTEDEAAKAIKEFVKASNEKLKSGQSVVFEGIGIVAPKPDGNLYFHQSQHSNLLPETFGMEPVELKKTTVAKKGESTAAKKRRAAAAKKAKTETTDQKEKSSRSGWLWFLGIIVIFGIGFGVWWFYFNGDKTIMAYLDKSNEKKTETPAVDSTKNIDSSKLVTAIDSSKLNTDIKKATNPTVTGTPAKISGSENVNETLDTHFRNNSVIYLIVGSFKSKENASNYALELQNQGFDSQVLNAENGFYRVTIGNFPNTSRAMKVYTKFTDKYPKKDIWAL